MLSSASREGRLGSRREVVRPFGNDLTRHGFVAMPSDPLEFRTKAKRDEEDSGACRGAVFGRRHCADQRPCQTAADGRRQAAGAGQAERREEGRRCPRGCGGHGPCSQGCSCEGQHEVRQVRARPAEVDGAEAAGLPRDRRRHQGPAELLRCRDQAQAQPEGQGAREIRHRMRRFKDEEERLGCFNGFVEKLPKLPS